MGQLLAGSYPKITKSDFNKACIIGGFIAGFIGALIIIIISHSSDIGYRNIDILYFKEKIRIVVCILQISLGCLLGWICSKFAWPKNTQIKNTFKQCVSIFCIFIVSFISIISFRQLMTRDALVRPNDYERVVQNLNFLNTEKCIAQDYKNLHHAVKDDTTNTIKYYIRKGGGYFGEPDFESLATGLMGGIAFVILVMNLSKSFNRNSELEKNSPSFKEMLMITLKSSFYGFIGWMGVYLIFIFLTKTTCLIHKYDFIYARWLFEFEFPHPERFLLNFMLCTIYVFCFLFAIRAHSTPGFTIIRKNIIQQKNGNHEEKLKMKTVKIFLASALELNEDRKALRQFISIENDRMHQAGVYFKIIQWECFFDAIPQNRLQSEYIKSLKECDVFLGLFFNKVGKYSAEEFENAFKQFKETGRPYIYTYFKELNPYSSPIKEEDLKSIVRFEKKLIALGHFKTVYKDTNDLLNQFKRQLEGLLPKLYPT